MDMCGGIKQAAPVMLSVNLKEQPPDLGEQFHADGLVIDKGFATAILGQAPPQRDIFIGINIDVMFLKKLCNRIRQSKTCRALRLIRSSPHKTAI